MRILVPVELAVDFGAAGRMKDEEAPVFPAAGFGLAGASFTLLPELGKAL